MKPHSHGRVFWKLTVKLRHRSNGRKVDIRQNHVAYTGVYGSAHSLGRIVKLRQIQMSMCVDYHD